jgi:hypothetical protein
MQDVPAGLAAKRDSGRAQESNTRNYLATGDVEYLKKEPNLQVPYPNAEGFASILASPTVRAILPTNIRPPLTPTSIESEPSAAFVAEGCYSTTPAREFGMTLGSYGPQGNGATGQASLQFGSNMTSGIIEIPVAGYPLNGNKLEVEQRGQRTPIVLESNPHESWVMAFAKVRTGAFSIVVTDESASFWLAVGAPVMTGRLDSLVSRLLASYPVFIMLGLVAGVLLVTRHGLLSRGS